MDSLGPQSRLVVRSAATHTATGTIFGSGKMSPRSLLVVIPLVSEED